MKSTKETASSPQIIREFPVQPTPHFEMTTPIGIRLTNAPCMILAGGQSRRYGLNKAFACFRGECLIDVVIKRIEQQTTGPIAINASSDMGFDDYRHPVIGDQLPGRIGPLAGLHAAMDWARELGYAFVVTTAVDTPILPLNFIERLLLTGAPSIASVNALTHVVHGVWPTRLATQLQKAVERGVRSVHSWAAECQAAHCEFHEESGLDPFFNVNTPEDLQMLEKIYPVS